MQLVSASSEWKSFPCCNYLEFTNTDERYSLLHATSHWNPPYFRLECGQWLGRPLIYSKRSPVRLASESNLFFGSQSRYDGPSILRFHEPHYSSRWDCAIRDFGVSSRDSHYTQPPRIRSGIESSRDVYPFGILRSDLRKYLPAGYPPWYLPGSPNNLQTTNLYERESISKNQPVQQRRMTYHGHFIRAVYHDILAFSARVLVTVSASSS